ncbi:MAG: hypothetical protein R3C16_13340 [Hyphomonadaceae bacterium]
MEVWIQIGVGLVLLGLGGEAVVRGAVGVARKLGVSELLIGLVLVGFGTSTPEILTSISASLRGSAGVAIGNVVGSNISNILLIAAIAAIARPITVPRAAIFRDGLTMIVVSIGLVVFALVYPVIEAWVGAIMLMLAATSGPRGSLNAAAKRPRPNCNCAEGEAQDALARQVFGFRRACRRRHHHADLRRRSAGPGQ